MSGLTWKQAAGPGGGPRAVRPVHGPQTEAERLRAVSGQAGRLRHTGRDGRGDTGAGWVVEYSAVPLTGPGSDTPTDPPDTMAGATLDSTSWPTWGGLSRDDARAVLYSRTDGVVRQWWHWVPADERHSMRLASVRDTGRSVLPYGVGKGKPDYGPDSWPSALLAHWRDRDRASEAWRIERANHTAVLAARYHREVTQGHGPDGRGWVAVPSVPLPTAAGVSAGGGVRRGGVPNGTAPVAWGGQSTPGDGPEGGKVTARARDRARDRAHKLRAVAIEAADPVTRRVLLADVERMEAEIERPGVRARAIADGLPDPGPLPDGGPFPWEGDAAADDAAAERPRPGETDSVAARAMASLRAMQEKGKTATAAIAAARAAEDLARARATPPAPRTPAPGEPGWVERPNVTPPGRTPAPAAGKAGKAGKAVNGGGGAAVLPAAAAVTRTDSPSGAVLSF